MIVAIVAAPVQVTPTPAVQVQLPQAELPLPRPRADAAPETLIEDRVEEDGQAGEKGEADDGAKCDAELAVCGQAVLGARVGYNVEERHAK